MALRKRKVEGEEEGLKVIPCISFISLLPSAFVKYSQHHGYQIPWHINPCLSENKSILGKGQREQTRLLE